MISINDIVNSKEFLKSIQQLDDINVSISEMGGYCAHNHHHILYIIKELLGKKCKNYLEIGVALGSSISSVMQSDSPMKCFYGIDLFDINTGSENVDKVYKMIQSFNKHNHNFELIKGNSRSKNVINTLDEKLNNEGIDFLYIDGNHEFKYVLSDFWNYEKFMNQDGIIVFDDAVTNDVKAAINEIIVKVGKRYNVLGYLPENTYEKYHTSWSQYCKYKYNSDLDQVLKAGSRNWQFIMVKNDRL